jgi:hypothetical protein
MTQKEIYALLKELDGYGDTESEQVFHQCAAVIRQLVAKLEEQVRDPPLGMPFPEEEP